MDGQIVMHMDGGVKGSHDGNMVHVVWKGIGFALESDFWPVRQDERTDVGVTRPRVLLLSMRAGLVKIMNALDIYFSIFLVGKELLAD